MAEPIVELGEVRVSLDDKDADVQRAERIARLLFTHLRELIEREHLHLRADTELSRLVVPPVAVPGGAESDDALARAGAEGVYRALVQALAG